MVKSDRVEENNNSKLTPAKKDRDSHTPQQFKARPATVLNKKPFIPVLGARPVVREYKIELNTQKRAKDRAEFDRQLKQREEYLLQLKHIQEELKEKEARIEEAKLRKQTVFKANPSPKFKPVVKYIH